MKYAMINKLKDSDTVRMMCRVFQVSASGYYAWRKRSESARDMANTLLDTKIKRVYAQHKGRYGSPRITDELREQGGSCSKHRVAKRMQRLGIAAIAAKKCKVTTDAKHDLPVAPNVLNQDFSAARPNQKWVADITDVWTDEGRLYLATVMDLYSRTLIGWSMQRTMTQQLVCDALLMALWRRGFPKQVIVHSDRGSQYCSHRHQQLLKDNHLRCRMSGKGNCYDNAAMESFFHTLKVELIHRERYHAREQARQSIFEYIEAYYNTLRRHSANGNISPSQFEMMTNSL